MCTHRRPSRRRRPVRTIRRGVRGPSLMGDSVSQARLPATRRMSLQERRRSRLTQAQSVDLRGRGRYELLPVYEEEVCVITRVIYEIRHDFTIDTPWTIQTPSAARSMTRAAPYRVVYWRWFRLDVSRRGITEVWPPRDKDPLCEHAVHAKIPHVPTTCTCERPRGFL